jgi:nucleotide-binding universal stress UspA family protein
MSQAPAFHSIPRKILLPMDFSPSSDAALTMATDLAQHFRAELYLTISPAVQIMATNGDTNKKPQEIRNQSPAYD